MGGDALDAPVDTPIDSPSDAPTDAPSNAVTRTYGQRTGVDFVVITDDTYISDETLEAALNYGGTDLLRAEGDVGERILMRFDLSVIPMSAQVFAASVTFNLVQFDANATLTARPLLQA